MAKPTEAAQAANAKTDAAQAAGVKVTYVPGRDDPVAVTWAKMVFEANKPRVVNDPRIVERARRNPWFRVEGSEPPEKGFDPAVDKPKNAVQYRAYAITWFKTVRTSAEMVKRWSEEEAMRAELEVGADDLDYIAKHYDPRLEQLKRMEQAGEAR